MPLPAAALLALALVLAACASGTAPVGDASPPDALVEDGSGTGGL